MTAPPFDVGAYVLGGVDSPRALVRHLDLLTAYADGLMAEKDETREAYLSHFAFGPEMTAHYRAHHGSVAEYAGPCWARRLVFDIDRPTNLVEALEVTRRLVQTIHQRYPEMEGDVPIYFSGNKGFNVCPELAHNPPPTVGFHHVARTFAEALAAWAEVKIDAAVFSINQPIRLPNTRHPKTGLFKRRIDSDALFKLDLSRILEIAKQPAGDGIPTVRTPPPQLVTDWREAEQETARRASDRTAARPDSGTADTRAPRYFLDLLRFGVDEGERHHTLFRCAAWLSEQGAPPSLCFALLIEPGQDVGLRPKDVERQIRCGIDHARKQRSASTDPPPNPNADPDGFERWAIGHEADPLPSSAGALAATQRGAE